MPIRWSGISLLLIASLGLAACSGAQPQAPSVNNCYPGATAASCAGISGRPQVSDNVKGFQSNETQASTNSAGGLSWMFNFNGNAQGGGSSLGVNAFLWRGTLDTLSFMPLASADPFGGVIITDWYTPPSSPDERFKATAYILGREFRSNNLRISIFRQVMQDGHWVDAAVSPVTINDIENKVLTRARQLRVESRSESS